MKNQSVKYLSKGEGSQLQLVEDIGFILASDKLKRVDNEVVSKML